MPTRRPAFLYSLLTALFAITLLYQVRYLPDVVRSQRIDSPFFFVDAGSNRIALTTSEVVSYGIHTGDRLLAVDGVPFTGSGVLGRARAMRRPGVPMVVTIAPKNGNDSDQRTIALPVTAESRNSWDALSTFVVQILLPAVSLLLGFWVVYRRPRDPMAWLLLGLMMSFPHILRAFLVPGWPPGWREAGVFYDTVLNALFPILMFLFGRFFPEPFPRGNKADRVFGAIQWLCGVPFGILALAGVVVEVVSLSDYRSVAGIGAVLAGLEPVIQVLAYILVGSFFSAMGIKLGVSKSPDAERRLRFLYWGAIAAFAPALVPTLYAFLRGKDANEIFPSWVMTVVVIPLLLFPLTLTYVIVVQKAMGVGVAIRQGLQYTLARGGIRVLQIAAIAAVVISATTLAANVSHDSVQKAIVILVGIAAYFTIRKSGDGLRTWLDRRFFRENYNAENVLSELSEHVRSIVETKPLLETVAARISETLHVPQVAVLWAEADFIGQPSRWGMPRSHSCVSYQNRHSHGFEKPEGAGPGFPERSRLLGLPGGQHQRRRARQAGNAAVGAAPASCGTRQAVGFYFPRPQAVRGTLYLL